MKQRISSIDRGSRRSFRPPPPQQWPPPWLKTRPRRSTPRSPGFGSELAAPNVREANRLAREAGKPLRRPDPPDDEMNSWAEAIRIGDSYFYRVGDIVVPAWSIRT